MNIDPRHLVQIAAIVDSRTFAEAAAQLGLTQPALSRTIAFLERRLGTPLFERHTRPLVATECGLALAEKGRVVRIATGQASDVGLRLAGGLAGEARIGAPPFLCDRALSDALAGFHGVRPGVRVNLRSAYLPELRRALLTGDLDLAFGPAFLSDTSEELQFERLTDDVNVIVARVGHPLSRRVASPPDLEGATWIGHGERSLLNSEMQAYLTSIGVGQVRLAFVSESSGGVLTMLQGTDCLTMLPSSAVSHRIAAGELAVVETGAPAPRRPLGLAYRSSRLLSPAANALRIHLRNVMNAERQQPAM